MKQCRYVGLLGLWPQTKIIGYRNKFAITFQPEMFFFHLKKGRNPIFTLEMSTDPLIWLEIEPEGNGVEN